MRELTFQTYGFNANRKETKFLKKVNENHKPIGDHSNE